MRPWLICAAVAALFILHAPVRADDSNHQHHHMTPIPANGGVIDCKDPEVAFSYFGYMHCTLHKFGTIDELFKRTNSECCEGVMSGECRVTSVQYKNGKPYALLDGMWCEVFAKVHFDISFPTGVQAVVCASAIDRLNGDPVSGVRRLCPATYCAAVAPGL